MQIIKSLTDKEVALVKNYYLFQKDFTTSKRLELFELCCIRKDINDLTVAKILYNRKPDSALSHLKRRLREDILSIILVEEASKKYKTPFVKAEFECRKKLLQGGILIRRGAYDAALKVLAEAADIAETYELPGEHIILLDIISTTIGVTSGVKKYKQFRETIEEKLDLLKKMTSSRGKLFLLGLPQLFNQSQDLDYQDYTKDVVKEIQSDLKTTGSPHIQFWYANAKNTAYYYLKQFTLALESADQLLHIVTHNKAVHSKPNIAGAHLSRAVCLVQLGRFKEAEKSLITAGNHFRTGSVNHFNTMRYLFHCYFVQGTIEASNKTLGVLQKSKTLKGNEFNLALVNYYKACMYIVTGKNDEANSALNKCLYLVRVKSAWSIGVRYLEVIMALSEPFDYDYAESRIVSLQTLLRQPEFKDQTRMRIILQVCKHLVKNQLRFDKTQKAKNNDLLLLRENSELVFWDPLGFEIIRFDEWFNLKMSSVYS